VTEVVVIRRNRHLTAQSRDGRVLLSVAVHNPATGRDLQTLSTFLEGKALDFLYVALTDPSCLGPEGDIRLHLGDLVIAIDWRDAARRFMVLGSNRRIAIRLSPTDAYRLAALCRRTADWAFLREMLERRPL
jgi:hypothetical protein